MTTVALKELVEQTVAGLGFELLTLERSAAGLLRLTVDFPWPGPSERAQRSVSVEDCETITRQLLLLLQVEGVEFNRLEVSSPGIDRPLRATKDFERFAGQVIDVTLKAPVGAIGAGQVSALRKKFRGTLERVLVPEGQPSWQVVWSDPVVVKPGQRVSKKRPAPPLHALGFALDEIKEARLAPIVSFKGRGATGTGVEEE